MKKINKEVQKIIKDFKIKPSVLKEIKHISDKEFAKAYVKFTIDLINYTRCCKSDSELFICPNVKVYDFGRN